MKYSCFIFSEGGRDKKFLMALVDLKTFKYHTKNWFFILDNASGGSPKIILEQCQKLILGKEYRLILCFIDLDMLKKTYPKNWLKEKEKLEKAFPNFSIIWQTDNLEGEYRKVLRTSCLGKHKLNMTARKKVKEFINSAFWKRILKPIENREEELDSADK